MAHYVEPTDVADSICDFDNKENSLHHNNVLTKGPCTEKGYEELEVSELNMKLRYSITPTSSPMSKSFTANCLDNKQFEAGDNNITNTENPNLTRSMNSPIIRSDSIKKVLPLQSLPTDQFIDGNRNALRPTVAVEKDITITGSEPNDLDEHLSIPSSSSSLVHTPEATTPTKEFNKQDGSSPIMRGLKSVFNMFRPSQSPITNTEDDNNAEVLSPPVINSPNTSDPTPSTMLVSTPLAAQKTALSKRESTKRDTIVFNDDLENELEWKDESTIIFSTEKVPIHKLFMTQNKPIVSKSSTNVSNDVKPDEKFDSTVEYMDISYNDSIVQEKTGTEEVMNKNDITNVTESDSEFLDCETTFSKSENRNDVSLDIKLDGEVQESPKEGSSATVTNESLNDTLSKTRDSLTLSADSTKGSVTIEKDVTSVIEEQVEIAKEEITDNPMSNTCEVSVSLSQPKAEHPIAIKCIEKVSSNDVIKLNIGNHTYSNTNQIGNVVQNIDNITSSVDRDKLSEGIVVSSLSQIPLIADPRVLLFNIPVETSKTDQTMQNIEDLNASPADIPLPDDEDLEKVEITEDRCTVKQFPIDEIKEDTCTFKQFPIDDNLKIDIMEQISYDDTLCMKLTETVSSLKEIPIKDVIIKASNEQHEQIKVTEPVQLKKEGAFEHNVDETDISSYTNITESLPEFDQVVDKDDTVKQYVVNDVASIHEVEVIPSHNVKYSETTIQNEHVDVNQEILLLKETKEIPPSTSEIKHCSDFMEKETNKVTKSDFTEVKDVEIIPPKAEGVLDDKIPFPTLNLDDKNENIIKENNVEELHSTIDEMDISYSKSVTNETINMCAAYEEINGTGQNIDEHSANSNLKEDIGIKVSSSAIKTISEQETSEEDVISTEIRQENFEFDKNVADGMSEKNNDIVALTTKPIWNSEKQEKTTAQESTKDLPVETVSTMKAKVETDAEEEIVASKDNSPFVAISADDLEESPKSQGYDNFENVTNPQTQSDIELSRPLSPKIISKGYNLNFDEIEDPFATKTKIRLSSSRDSSPNESFENIEINVSKPKSDKIKNRRKSQPARTRPANTKKLNSTFSGSSKTSINQESDQPKLVPKETKTLTLSTGSSKPSEIPVKNYVSEEKPKCDEVLRTGNDAEKILNEIQTQDSEVVDEGINTSSSELSTYQSAEALSHEGRDCKNVFNLPEIDDANFNPFVTKSNVCQSPVPSQQSDDPFVSKNEIRSALEPTDNSEETESESAIIKNLNNYNPHASFETKCPVLEEQNLLNDATNTTCSLKETEEKDITVCEEIRSAPVPNDNSEETENEKAVIKNLNDYNQHASLETKCPVLEEQNLSNDATNTTCSSKDTEDKDTTVHEVNTEDEDTIEGPFLESEDLNYNDKLSEFVTENLDIMKFSKLPTVESANQEAGELFIDAEAFEFLWNQNEANEVADSGKESLFLKFDPLYAKRMSSDGVVSALNRVQKKKQSTPKKVAELPLNDITFDKSPVAGPSTINVTQETDTHNITEDSIEDLNITVTKPMMVVTPVNPVPSPRNKAITPVRSNRQSLTFTSPAIAVIDRLLSMSANNSLIGHEVSVTEVRGHNEADLALTQLRELLADKEISVYNLKSESIELKTRISILESQMKNLEALSEERLRKINDLNEKLVEKTKLNKSMASVVEEYERTIASLIAETEQDRKRHAEERLQLINERDEQTRHLTSMEVSFSDIHSKYEKSKQVILGFKSNEDSLKKNLKEFEETVAKMQTNYELLKQHATSKLNHANEELQKMNRAHETEVLKLNAMMKRQEMHITSLEENILQKTKANEELTAICDELINRVG